MKRIALFILVFSVISTFGFSEDPSRSMHDAFAKGFQAVKARNKAEAVQHFQEAGQFSVQAGESHGCLDAGNALLKLGEPAQAAGLFDQAFQMAQQKQDWRIAIASGYAFASLPADQGKKQTGTDAFNFAAQAAQASNDWIGMTEAANGLIQLGDRDRARQTLESAKILVDQAKSAQGAQVIAQLYEKIGLAEESQGMKLTREGYVKLHQDARTKVIPPPPGWSPVGESIAGPKIPGIEQQKAARASADKDIASKNEWILQQEQLELEHEKMAHEYSRYYYYPYGYASSASYQPWGWDLLIPWADSCASSYSYVGGYYVYSSGPYTGFGFDFGYASGNSFFGVSLAVFD